MGWTQAFLVAVLAGLAGTSGFWDKILGEYHWYFGPVVFLLTLGGQASAIPKRARFDRDKKRYLLTRIFDDGVKNIIDATDASLRLNIMVFGREKRPTGEVRGAKEKTTFIKRRCLVYFHTYGFKPTDTDGALTIFEDQGVAGAAVRHERFAYGRREVGANGRVYVEGVGDYDDMHRNLTQTQRQKAADLQLILSYPIRGLKRYGTEAKATGEIIAVVNIDSRVPLTSWVASHPDEYRVLSQQVLPQLAEATAYILA